MSMSYGGNWFSIQTWFQNIPFRRIKAGVLKLGGMKTIYIRFYEVLPGMSKEKFAKHMEKVRNLLFIKKYKKYINILWKNKCLKKI